MKKILFIVFLTFVGFTFSCKNTNSSESTQQTESNSTNETTEVSEIPQKEKETTLYAWVDKLRIREQPTTKSEIVAEVKEGTSFIYMNEKTDFKERINLRGTLYNEPWLKIKTKEGKVGWVFGGAVKFYEPVVDANPSPYDPCFELWKNGKNERAFTCFEKTRAKQLAKESKRVNASDKGLKLLLLTGKRIELNNVADSTEENFTYRYWNYLPQIGYYLVDQLYDEYGSTYQLVNDKSGKATTISGFPKPSPNNKHILTFNADTVDHTEGESNNTIVVYGFPGGRFKKLLEKNLGEMEPHTPKWIDDKTVEVSLVPAAHLEGVRPKNIKVVMNDDGEWEVKE